MILLSIQRMIASAFGAALFILLAIAAVSYFSLRRLDSTTEWVQHTYSTRSTLNRIIALITDGEAAQRGYIITGEAEYLEPHHIAIDSVGRKLEELERLLAGNPSQLERLKLLESLVAEKLAFATATIEVRRSEGEVAAMAAVRTDRGMDLMDEIRRVSGEMHAEVAALLAERIRRQQASIQITTAVMIAGFFFAFTIAVLAMLFIRRDLGLREQAEHRAMEAKEAAEAASRAKSEFLARMSHELRTPLNSVIGFSNVLLKNKAGNLRPQDLTYLERIQANGNHLLSLINDILDLSKIEAGKVELEVAPVSLDGLVQEILAEFERHPDRKDLILRADVPTSLAPLETDASKLGQVLINLVGNALKFTERGSVTVSVHVHPATRRPFRLDVIDTGIGIPAERLETIFSAFEQADVSTSRQYGGTGLGLAISRALCELMGYRLTVDSEPGKGTTFSILFAPRAPATGTPNGHETSGSEASVEVAPRSPQESPLVLVIDDEVDARVLLSHHLEDIGCQVAAAGSGEEGLAMARQLRPDLITLDLLMPSSNGWDTLKEIKADPALQDTPVIVVSIVAGENRGRVLGAVDVIDKPIGRGDFIRAVKRNLGQPPGRVLIIEDDEDVRRLLVRYLGGDGDLEVRTAADGRAGFAVLEEFTPDVIVLDLLMPGMGGIEFLEALRSDARHLHLPVVIVTGQDLSAAQATRLQSEVLAILGKGDQLEGALRRVLDEVWQRRGGRDDRPQSQVHHSP